MTNLAQFWKYLFPLIFITLINPTIALFVSFLILIQQKNKSDFVYIQFFFMLALWVGCINMTKDPTSDTIHYLTWFNSVDISNPIHSVLYYKNEEYNIQDPVFSILSVLLYYISFGNSHAYILLCTIIIYFFHYLAIYSILKTTNATNTEIVALVIALTFYNPFFIQSIHGLRQMLASAFMIYAISKKINRNYKCFVIYSLLAIFTHSSVLIYILMAFVPQLYKKNNYKIIALVVAIFIAFVTFYQGVGVFLGGSDIELLSSVGSRLVNANNDTTGMGVSLKNFNVYCIPLLLISFFNFIHRGRLNQGIFFQYAFVLTYAAIVAFQFAPVFSIRYFFFVGSFFPFVTMYLFNPGSLSAKRFSICVAAFLFTVFFFYLGLGTSYAPMFEILTNSFPSFF